MREPGSSQKRGALAKTRATKYKDPQLASSFFYCKKEDRVIELPSVTTVPTAEDEKHSRFSIYHRKISHSAMDCYVLTSATSALL